MKIPASREHLILHETAHLHLFDADGKLEIRLNVSTHSVLVGESPSIEQAKRTMERLERYPRQLHAFHGEFFNPR